MTNIETLKYWCHKVLPLVYDDSLSYYEVLCKVAGKLNEVIDTTNEFGEHLNEQLLEVRELVNTEIARIESGFNEKLVEVKSAIKEELTSPNSFNGNALVPKSVSMDKLSNDVWEWASIIPVNNYSDLDAIFDNYKMGNTIIRLEPSNLGELYEKLGDDDYIGIANMYENVILLFNPNDGNMWVYAKNSNGLIAVNKANIENRSITGIKIAVHTVEDVNIATDAITDRALRDTYAKYIDINGNSPANIDEALSVGGRYCVYRLTTEAAGDLTPNDTKYMVGFVTNYFTVDTVGYYEMIFVDNNGECWYYNSHTKKFRKESMNHLIFTVSGQMFKYSYDENTPYYVGITDDTFLPAGMYTVWREGITLYLHCITNGNFHTYNLEAEQLYIDHGTTFVGVISDANGIKRFTDQSIEYSFVATADLLIEIGASGLCRMKYDGTNYFITTGLGAVKVYNPTDGTFTDFKYPLNTALYLPSFKRNNVINGNGNLAMMLQLWIKDYEVDGATVRCQFSGVTGGIINDTSTTHEISITKLLFVQFGGNPTWRVENLDEGIVKFVSLTPTNKLEWHD